MKDMFSIGELASYQNISKQTLIYYDKIGLFKPAYVDPDNKYRYYTVKQVDYLDTILIMKEMGFTLNEIQEHMKNYTIDTSLITMRKQLTVIDQQITHLELVRNRLTHRCRQLEHVKAFHEQNQEVTIKEVRPKYLLWADIERPQTFREISIATKKCFSQALKDELPIYFQTGVIVPYKHILEERYTEASVAFIPIEKPKKQKTSACCQKEKPPAFIIAATICLWIAPIKSCWNIAKTSSSRLFQIPMNFVSMTILPPVMKTNILRRYFSMCSDKWFLFKQVCSAMFFVTG